VLRNIQRSDLSLFAAYRKIPILGTPPASITYTRANTRSVYRKSVEAVYELLTSAQSPGAASDRAALLALDRRETHLALVKDRYPNIRANVLYSRLDTRGRGRLQVSAELPIMFAQTRRSAPPEVVFPMEPELTNGPRRERQSKLEASTYLQWLPVYRYTSQGTREKQHTTHDHINARCSAIDRTHGLHRPMVGVHIFLAGAGAPLQQRPNELAVCLPQCVIALARSLFEFQPCGDLDVSSAVTNQPLALQFCGDRAHRLSACPEHVCK